MKHSPNHSAAEPAWPFLLKASAAIVMGLLAFAVIDPAFFTRTITHANEAIENGFGGFYLWFTMLATLGFIALGLSPLGKLRIGKPGDKPTYSFWSWFAMIFSAGMGTGFMFWGTAEPLYHYLHPPFLSAVSETQRSSLAFAYTFFHWGLSPWAIYGLTAVAMGYFSYNCGRGFRVSSFLVAEDDISLRGRATRNLVDLLTLMAIVFGVSATLGMAVLNLEGGFETLWHQEGSPALEAGIMLGIAAIFIVSAWMGLDRGVKILSNVSMGISVALLLGLLALGPAQETLVSLGQGLWLYLTQFITLSLGRGDFADPHWLGDWTIKYWSWWIAWAPFVGIFLVLISRGRTIREIMLASIIAPTVFSCLWFSAFGQAAIHWFSASGQAASALDFHSVDRILYQVLEAYYHTPFVTGFCMLVIVLFVANSADSATYTIACLSVGDMERHPRKMLLLAWGMLFFALTMTLLLSGGIVTLNEITTVTVLPFTFLLMGVFAMFGFELWARNSQPVHMPELPPLSEPPIASERCPDPSP